MKHMNKQEQLIFSWREKTVHFRDSLDVQILVKGIEVTKIKMEKMENMKKKMGSFSKTYGNDKRINLKARISCLKKYYVWSVRSIKKNKSFILPLIIPFHEKRSLMGYGPYGWTRLKQLSMQALSLFSALPYFI